MEQSSKNSAEIIKDVVFDGTSTSANSDAREREKGKARGRTGVIRVDPARCDIWPGSTRDVQALGSARARP